jgi:ADP-ribose pyrophosphatase YjhB (NUDIX family)
MTRAAPPYCGTYAEDGAGAVMRESQAAVWQCVTMPVPEFITRLRAKIGNDLLWIGGVTAVVFDRGRVLLVQRADTGEWAPVTGILEPGEQPAAGAIREVREETGVLVRIQRLVSVLSQDQPTRHANGDITQHLDLCFRCEFVSGEPYAADDESVDAAWFQLDTLPPMQPRLRERIERALPIDAPVHFVR